MDPTTDLLTDRYGAPKYAGQRMDKADFLCWESDDNYVYEFNDGILEPTTGMRQDENFLLTNLENAFFTMPTFQQGGRLRAEMDFWVTDRQLRRADVSYFTSAQLQLMATGEKVIPGFVVEFASKNDHELVSLTKRHEYFDAGVQVVWRVYPEFKEVYVYTSPKTITVATGADVLSAAPALPDFQLTVAELFRR